MPRLQDQIYEMQTQLKPTEKERNFSPDRRGQDLENPDHAPGHALESAQSKYPLPSQEFIHPIYSHGQLPNTQTAMFEFCRDGEDCELTASDQEVPCRSTRRSKSKSTSAIPLHRSRAIKLSELPPSEPPEIDRQTKRVLGNPNTRVSILKHQLN